MIRFSRLLLSGFSALALAACGGGGGGSSSPTNTGGGGGSSGSTTPTYTPGVFAAESQFKSRCASPRPGTSDIAGTTTHENFWLRSWSNDKYLWFNEITDRDPASIADPADYFETQKTTATTASGAPKDRFHFIIPTDEYQQQVSSGASAGYGARFALIRSSVPRDIRVAYTEAGSPAEAASTNLARGTEILEIDGVDVVNGGTQAEVDTINAGLFPNGSGERHTFLVRDVGTNLVRTITMTSAIVTSAPVRETQIIDQGDRKIGYMLFNTFGTSIAEQGLFNAMTNFSNQGVDDLVLDLRYNGGGFLDISSELGFMIAGAANTNGRVYERLTFNSKHPTRNPVTGATLTAGPFLSTAQGFSVADGTALPSLNLNRVFILSTARTCSASESLLNALDGINVEVILIGGTTCGKPYGFYATDNCGDTYFSIQFRGENDKGFGDYGDGFSPDDGAPGFGTPINGCNVDDDFLNPLGDTNEAMFETALSYIENGVCPANAASSRASKIAELTDFRDVPTSLYKSDYLLRRTFLDENRILNKPHQP